MSTKPTTDKPLPSIATTQGDDCFLCQFLPFLKNIFPGHRDVLQDPGSNNNNNSNSNSNNNLQQSDDISSLAPTSRSVLGDEAEEDNNNNNIASATNMDFANADYRGFLLAIHPQHGFLLLHCTRKKKKPNHFQLPGGHVDAFEFDEAAKFHPTNKLEQLQMAGAMGAARELYEETGLDVRKKLDRLQPTQLYKQSAKQAKTKLMNEYKTRLFYTLHLTDEDFLRPENLSISDAAFLQQSMGAQPPPLMLKLSQEHSGFAFEKFPDVTVTLLQHHSGGKCSEALKMATAIKNPL